MIVNVLVGKQTVAYIKLVVTKNLPDQVMAFTFRCDIRIANSF
jgi:hypothetical protein